MHQLRTLLFLVTALRHVISLIYSRTKYPSWALWGFKELIQHTARDGFSCSSAASVCHHISCPSPLDSVLRALGDSLEITKALVGMKRKIFLFKTVSSLMVLWCSILLTFLDSHGFCSATLLAAFLALFVGKCLFPFPAPPLHPPPASRGLQHSFGGPD